MMTIIGMNYECSWLSWAGSQPWSPRDFSQSQVSLDPGQLHDTPWESMITFNYKLG